MSADFTDLLTDIMSKVWSYYLPVLICLGTIGNCLCVFVPFRTEMRNMVSRDYFVALAISNEAFIIFLLAERIFHFLGYDLFQTGICQFFIYIPTVLQFLRVYFIVAFIVERFKAVSFPQRRQAMCTLADAKMVIIGVTFLGFVLPSPLFRIHDSNCYMDEAWRNWKLGFSLANAIFVDVVPYVIITASGIRIGMSIRGPTARGRILTHSTTSGTDDVSAGQQSLSVLRAKQTKITRIFLIVAVVYICLNLPTNLAPYFIAIESNWSGAFGALYQIVQLFAASKVGIIFFLCCAVDHDFRQAALATILCHRQISSAVPQSILYTRGSPRGNTPMLTTSSGD